MRWTLHLRLRRTLDSVAYDEAVADATFWCHRAKKLAKALENAELAHADDLIELQRQHQQVIEYNHVLAGQLCAAEAALDLRKPWTE